MLGNPIAFQAASAAYTANAGRVTPGSVFMRDKDADKKRPRNKAARRLAKQTFCNALKQESAAAEQAQAGQRHSQ